MTESNNYEREYSELGFWEKLRHYAKSAGVEVVEKALLLYYATQDKETPAWAKAAVIGALGYFISLIDAVPDLTPFIGYTDDLGVLAMALATISVHVSQETKDKAAEKLSEWFGDDGSKQDAHPVDPDDENPDE
jgi:uncharacterized membrane protein YkvA (DUF1232 family)